MTVTAKASKLPVRIAAVIPTWGHFNYAAATIKSLFTGPVKPSAVIIVDDNSPDWNLDWYTGLVPDGVILRVHHHSTSGGLTRSVNLGLYSAITTTDCRHVAVINSDVLLASQCLANLSAAVGTRARFIAPLTNAPGTTNKQQDVRLWLSDYTNSDSEPVIESAQQQLTERYAGKMLPGPINGFFLYGNVAAWKGVAVDKELFLPARIDPMPSGRRNPTPLMTGQEDWIAARCRQLDISMGIALDAFAFHYRSISRGDAYRTSGSFRHNL